MALTRKQKEKMDYFAFVLDLKSNLKGLENAGKEASKLYIEKMQDWAIETAKRKAPVKTGATKRSIKKHRVKYTAGYITFDSWLEEWIKKGGNEKYTEKVKRIQETQHISRAKARRTVSNKVMKKVHPAYWAFRPTKKLLKDVKSQKVYEKYLQLKLKALEIK